MILTPKIEDQVLLSKIVKNLKNGELHIDNSDYVNWNSCFIKGLFADALKRQPTKGQGPLAYGSAIHKALEVYHASDKPDMDEVIQAGTDEAIAENLPAIADEKRNMESLVSTLWSYNADYVSRSDKFKVVTLDNKLLIEQGFSLPLGEFNIEPVPTLDIPGLIQIYWQGKIDMVVIDQATNELWIVDHKTTSVMGEKYVDGMLRSNQMLGYSWATEELTKVFDMKVAGVIINAIAVRKSGTEFRRWRIPYPQWQLDEWHGEVVDGCYELLEKLVRYLSGEAAIPNRESCVGKYGRCQFFDVCNMHPDMKDGTLFDDEQYKISTFDPLS